MDKLLITGPTQMNGTIRVSRAKNAYLPILAGVLLCPEKIHFKELPNLRDIRTITKLLENLGVKVKKINENISEYDASELTSVEATYELVKTMRASICVLGPLLARKKRARVSLPGGCAIGSRPIDLHLSSLEKMGAKITLEGGYVEAETDGLKGADIVLAFPSVGATENIMMAATLADGTTTIENAAKEPEVEDLANFLNSMGAKVSGIGTSRLVIEGVKELNGTEYCAIGDRIEAATYIMAGLATRSDLRIEGIVPDHLEYVTNYLREIGAELEVGEDFIRVLPSDLRAATVDTAPYPGFPTDGQAQLMALTTQIEGSSVITENIFENRFMHVPELKRLGADIELKGKSAIIHGRSELIAAPVMCTDLRASAALIIAALTAKGTTEISRVYHLDRGYDQLDEKLAKLGVDIRRVNDEA
jgi:UDP-N-acetylglucosamine 1-carboxyvinyltransferase